MTQQDQKEWRPITTWEEAHALRFMENEQVEMRRSGNVYEGVIVSVAAEYLGAAVPARFSGRQRKKGDPIGAPTGEDIFVWAGLKHIFTQRSVDELQR